MKRYLFPLLSVFVLASVTTLAVWTIQVQKAEAHCQIPCGIYDDPARIAQIREDSTTIAKAIANINQLAGKHDAQALNQATRWIMAKEDHATHIIDVVSEYFLTQKVKPVAEGDDGYDAYLKQLADHHAVMACAMKTKQNADPKTVDALNTAIDKLAVHYMPKKMANETHSHGDSEGGHDHGEHGHSHDHGDQCHDHAGHSHG